MPARLHVDTALVASAELPLPPDATRHVQVLRLQPGDTVHLFNGRDGEWPAEVLRMGRQVVEVRIGPTACPRREVELTRAVTLAVGMPANDRMDFLVEKACELGARTLQPLQCARSVLKLSGDRADKRRQHWQSIAIAAAEQCGRLAPLHVAPIRHLDEWLGSLREPASRHVLSLARDAQNAAAWRAALDDTSAVTLLSGPEGGLDDAEEARARAVGFQPLSLGPRTLRADTAPLAALASLSLG